MRRYVPVDIDDLPDIFDIRLAGEVYTFRIDYNDIADYYTVTIWNADGDLLLTQQPLILGELVGYDLPDVRLPRVDLRVMDETDQATDAGKAVFGYTVQIYLDVIDPLGSETDDPTIKPLGYDPDEPTDDYTDEEVSS
ncbi:phage baseplate plug protein [Lactobacillus gallinarum]|uniref:phage baseplate plug family protein n=1 Tax=Lactobacillus gallinarum TaxID=52242 RepID=UPI00388FB4EC